MYCGKCGNQIKTGSGFCEKCGTKIEEKVIEKKKNNKPLIMIVAIAVIAVVGIVTIGKSGNNSLEQEVVSQNAGSSREEVSQNVSNSEKESQQKVDQKENTEKEEKKQVVKRIEWEYPIYGSTGMTGKTEYNEFGDVIYQETTYYGESTIKNYSWEDGENEKRAYFDNGTLAIEIELDENGNKISFKRYEDDALLEETYYKYEGDLLKTSETYEYSERGRTETYLEYGEYGKSGNIVSEHKVCYGATSINGIVVETRLIDEYIYEYDENGELNSYKYFYEGVLENTTIYKYQESEDGNNCIGRAYVYDGENQELLEEYDEYKYEYDGKGNIVSKYSYNAEGDLTEYSHYEYDKNGNLLSMHKYTSEDILYYEINYTYYE